MFFFFQAEDGIRDLVRSRGLGDVYKRQDETGSVTFRVRVDSDIPAEVNMINNTVKLGADKVCLLYTSDAADERSSVDLGGRRIIKKKNTQQDSRCDETIDK